MLKQALNYNKNKKKNITQKHNQNKTTTKKLTIHHNKTHNTFKRLLHTTTGVKSRSRMDLSQIKQEKNLHRNRIKALIKGHIPTVIEEQSQRTVKALLSQQKYQDARSIGIFFSLPHELQTINIIQNAFNNNKHVFLPRVVNMDDSTMELYEIFDERDYNSGDLSCFKILEPTITLPPHIIKGSIEPLIKAFPDKYEYITQDTHYLNWINEYLNDDNDDKKDLVDQKDQNDQKEEIDSSIIPRPNLLTDDCIRRLDLLLCPFVACDLQCTRIGYGGGYYDRYIQRLQERRRSLGLEPVPIWGIGLEDQLITDLTLPFEPCDVKMDAVIVGDQIVGKV